MKMKYIKINQIDITKNQRREKKVIDKQLILFVSTEELVLFESQEKIYPKS